MNGARYACYVGRQSTAPYVYIGLQARYHIRCATKWYDSLHRQDECHLSPVIRPNGEECYNIWMSLMQQEAAVAKWQRAGFHIIWSSDWACSPTLILGFLFHMDSTVSWTNYLKKLDDGDKASRMEACKGSCSKYISLNYIHSVTIEKLYKYYINLARQRLCMVWPSFRWPNHAAAWSNDSSMI